MGKQLGDMQNLKKKLKPGKGFKICFFFQIAYASNGTKALTQLCPLSYPCHLYQHNQQSMLLCCYAMAMSPSATPQVVSCPQYFWWIRTPCFIGCQYWPSNHPFITISIYSTPSLLLLLIVKNENVSVRRTFYLHFVTFQSINIKLKPHTFLLASFVLNF